MPTGPNNRKLFQLNSPGTATTIGADDIDYITYWFENVDLTAGTYSATPRKATVDTPTEFRDNKLRFLNPAQTKTIRIRVPAILNDYDLALPLLTSNDDFLLLSHPAQIYNKTISVDANTIIATGISSGDLLKSNGTKFTKMVRGNPGQVLMVTDDGLDLVWSNPVIGEGGGGGGGGIPDDNSVTTAKIVDGAVTTAKVVDGAITSAKIAVSTITSDDIANSAIITDKINNLAVTAGKIADATIVSGKIADNAITTDKITDLNVTNAKLAGSIANSKLVQITDKNKLPSDILYSGSAITSMSHETWGYVAGSNTTTGGGVGLLDPLTLIGAHTTTMSNNGVYIEASTGTTTGTVVGQKSTNNATRRSLNPKFFARIMTSDTANIRMILGLSNNSSTPTGATVDDMDGDHGVGLLLKNNDTSYRLVRNDSTATDTELSLSVTPVATPISWYMELNDATPSVSYKLWTTNNGDTSLTPAAEGTQTTVLPGSTSNLHFILWMSNSTALDKIYYRWKVEVRNKW